jgi:hypothetical protein
MAGPVATVLVPEPLTDPDRLALLRWVESVSDYDPAVPPTLDAFWVRDTRPVGGGYVGEDRPFAVEVGLQPDWQPEQFAALAEAFGFAPRDELAVVAFCNRHEDHRVLGELALSLAERFGGVINLGGALWPSLPAAEIDILDPDWRRVEPYFRRMVEGVPGRVVGLRSGPEWVTHVADAAFLRAWLTHPHFHMVK